MIMLMLCSYAFAQNSNLTFRSNIPYPFQLANIGGYVDGQGNEYALVGTGGGLSIVDVTDPDNPFEAFAVAGAQSNWREVKTWLSYAYVTNESGNGLQIINLSNLPASVTQKNYTGNGTIAGQLNTIHALHIDNGFCYLYGTDLFDGAAVILNLNVDPWNPVYLGHTPSNGSTTQSYIHDGYVRNDTLYAGYIYAGEMRIYNCANKANPVLLATQLTPGQFTHNTWLSADSKYVFTTDEVNDSYLTAYDISNLSNITEVDRFQTTPGSGSVVHNTHILEAAGGEFAVTSWYKDGVVITDVTRPHNMVQTGRYDTYTQGTGGGFSGDWGVYPYLPSGTIVASDINNGLFVLTPTYVRACYLEGVITDSITGSPISGATVQILTTSVSASSVITGDYATGIANAGTYSVQVSKPGYFTKTISGVSLSNGNVTLLDVELSPLSTIVMTGQVVEAGTLNPIPFAHVQVSNAQFQYNLTCNASGNFSISNFVPDFYDVMGGQWGWITNCSNINVSGGAPIQIILNNGYYDDFTFDFNWTATSAGSSNNWERGEPIGTTNMGTQANPELDVTNDCADQCYVTDNGGGGAWDNDVDGGSVTLTSPVFDLTTYSVPLVKYYRWFANLGNNGGGNPDDSMTVKLTNGITTVTLETILNNSPGNSSWVPKSYNVASLLTPTANMQLIVSTADWGPVFNIVEGGLDKFEVSDVVGIVENNSAKNLISAYPNPFSSDFTIHLKDASALKNASIQITDIAGRIVLQQSLTSVDLKVRFDNTFDSGMYFIKLLSGNNLMDVIKANKLN